MVSHSDAINRRQFLRYGGILGVGSLLAGCTGEPPDENGGGGGDGQEFIYVTTQRPSSIDPAKSTDELENIYATNVYDPLVRYDYEFPPTVSESIATDWELSDDGLTYTFDLRDDATFHNGDQVTAEDVAFSVERMMSIGEGPTWMWEGILTKDSATVLDETTVEIQLEESNAPFLDTMAYMFIVDQDQVLDNEEDGDLGSAWLEDNAAGSGPLRLEDYSRGEQLSFSRNDDWWGTFPDNSYSTVVFDISLEVSTLMGMMKNGDAHLTDRWLSATNYQTLADGNRTKLSETYTYNSYYLFMNMRKEPLDDVHVRRAIAYAFDYDAALNDILQSKEPIKGGPMPDAMKHSTAEGVRTYEHDLEAAESEIAESQYDTDEIEFTYVYQPAIDTNKNIGLMMQDQLSDVGITVNPEEAPWTRIVELASDPDQSPDMFPLWGTIQYNDPDAYLWSIFHSSSVNTYLNGANYATDEMDQLLVEGRRTLDEEKRAEIYKEIQQIIGEDAPAVWVANDATRFGLKGEVEGFNDNGIMGYTHQFQRYNS